MTWSTRELAELAGTNVRTVRHYHDVGLLELPERRANGYKSYGVAHLVRVLRIRRLSELGFSLSQIAAMGDIAQHPEEELRTLDAELAGTIERLQRVRGELAQLLEHSAPADLPTDLALAAANVDMSDADRSFVVVMTRVLGTPALDAYAKMLQTYDASPVDAEFDNLPVDADEPTRRELAERMAVVVRGIRAEHPGLEHIDADAPHGVQFTARTIGAAMTELYNEAQLDVLRRLGPLLQER